jgi:hypothetical protein
MVPPHEKDVVIVPIDLFKNSKPIDTRVYCELDLLFEGGHPSEYIPHDAEFAETCQTSVEELRQSLIRLRELGWFDFKVDENETELTRKIIRFKYYDAKFRYTL